MARSSRVAPVLRVALLLCALSACAAGGSFRPPAVPLFTQSPLVNVWSKGTRLAEAAPSSWSDVNDVDFFSAVRVDGASFVLMGSPTPAWANGSLGVAPQVGPAAVEATTTTYMFAVGGVSLALSFKSPLLAGDDWDLLSRPAHYAAITAAATDGAAHEVAWYFDITATVVVSDAGALVAWQRLPVPGAPGVAALQLGAAAQAPLSSTADRMSWGLAYLLTDTGAAATVLAPANATRGGFMATGALPSSDAGGSPAPLIPSAPTGPASGPQVGVDRPGSDMPGYPVSGQATASACWGLCNATAGCLSWAFGIPGAACGGEQALCWLKNAYIVAGAPNACRVSGVQGGWPQDAGFPVAAAAVHNLGPVSGGAAGAVTAYVVFAVDEVLSIDYFGAPLPPYWRRDLPVNSSGVVPGAMLAAAWSSYEAVSTLSDDFDRTTAAKLVTVGGDAYATIAKLTYRQVFGAMQLTWRPSSASALYFLKEISSCGCLNTADVVYPAFPQVLYYSPELMRLMVLSHLEYAANMTNQPYPLPFAPHHLGFWPIADLPYTQQENMPLEETAWDLLIIAAIAQRQGGDLTWLTPFWPLLQTWYDFLVTLLPFPQEQLSTDDFDGVLYNATNLAVKGVAAVAAYGYIYETYTGDAAGAAAIYATAARYAGVVVQYAWTANGTADAHFMIGYAGSQGDGGDPASWPMLYNALWLRLLGFDNLLPNQGALLAQQQAWYAANVMEEYGLPLNSRKTYTKDDWMTFLAATYYDVGVPPAPSAFSAGLFEGLHAWANATAQRTPLSDWTQTTSSDMVGFTARPVYGAMWAPVLVVEAAGLGLGRADDAALVHARAVFGAVHAAATAAAPT